MSFESFRKELSIEKKERLVQGQGLSQLELKTKEKIKSRSQSVSQDMTFMEKVKEMTESVGSIYINTGRK